MKIQEYNSAGRRGFGKSMLVVSDAVFKSIILLFTSVPAAMILKSVFDQAVDGDEKADISIMGMIENMGGGEYFTFVGFMVLAFFIGFVFREGGLKHLHEAEELRKHEKLMLEVEIEVKKREMQVQNGPLKIRALKKKGNG